MNRTISSALLSLALLLLIAQPVHALTVIIDSNGLITIGEGQVLGDEDEQEVESEQESDQNESEKKQAEQRREQQQQQLENQRETAKQAAEQKRETAKQAAEQKREQQKKTTELKIEKAKQLRTIQQREQKQLRIKNTNQRTEVEIESKDDSADELENERLETRESITTDQLQLRLPARQKVDDNSELETESETDESEDSTPASEERRLRTDEFEINTLPGADGTQETELRAGTIKAKLRAAEFVVDPETNTVTITTPNGQTHDLVHLPDQAIEQMTAAGLINTDDLKAEEELEVDTEADGRVVYRTKTFQRRKLFGLVPFTVEQEVSLTDDTGEATSKPTNGSLLNQLLLRLSQ